MSQASKPAEPAKPLDVALDLFVYAPVGLALAAAEEIPKLAVRGRATVTAQLTMARMLGQFAVAQGRRELDRRFGGSRPAPVPTPPSDPVTTPYQPAENRSYEDLLASDPVTPDPHPEPVVTPVEPVSPDAGGAPVAPPTGGLAIPGYDSLSASQVVQRLAGLSKEELAAVGAYEEAHRGRRTILTRVRQLQDG